MDNHSQLTRLPNPVFIQIFQHFDSNELLKLKLISRRVNRLINKNISYLERPSIDHVGFQLRHIKSSKNGIKKNCKRFQIELRKSTKKSAKIFNFTENETDQNIQTFVRQNISQFRLNNSLVFRGCELHSTFLHSFIHPTIDLSSIQELSFEFCELNVSNGSFYEFIRRTSCSKLAIEFCTISSDCVINNELFAYIKELDYLQIQTQSPIHVLEIDDSTIDHWLKQSLIPTKIDLNNSTTQFTIDGILRVIRAIQSTIKNSKSNISWNLGHCNGTILELFTQIQQQQSLNFSKNYSICLEYAPNNRIAIKINLKSPISLKSPLEALKCLANSPYCQKSLELCEVKFTLLNSRI